MIKFIKCDACKGTGDYRGLYGKTKPDFKSEENKCLHCNGTGDMSVLYSNTCKYCMQPCNGYACDSCLQTFEPPEEEYA